MSILIKGMKMPERCEGCLMYRHNAEYDYAYCCISSVNVLGHGNARLNNCPLVEVPTPHGRLIDAEKLERDIEEYHLSDGKFQHWVQAQNSIIEAEEGEKHETD